MFEDLFTIENIRSVTRFFGSMFYVLFGYFIGWSVGYCKAHKICSLALDRVLEEFKKDAKL